MTEDDAAAVAGLLRNHKQLLPFACGEQIEGCSTTLIATELSRSSAPRAAAAAADPAAVAERARLGRVAIATPLHAAASAGAICAADALLRAAAHR